MAKLVPVDSIILSHDPCMWLLWGHNSAQLSTVTQNKHHVDNDLFARYKGGVYVHWGFWCNVPDPGQNQFGHAVRRDYDLELVKGYEVRGFHYALYRMYPKGERPRTALPRAAKGPAGLSRGPGSHPRSPIVEPHEESSTGEPKSPFDPPGPVLLPALPVRPGNEIPKEPSP